MSCLQSASGRGTISTILPPMVMPLPPSLTTLSNPSALVYSKALAWLRPVAMQTTCHLARNASRVRMVDFGTMPPGFSVVKVPSISKKKYFLRAGCVCAPTCSIGFRPFCALFLFKGHRTLLKENVAWMAMAFKAQKCKHWKFHKNSFVSQWGQKESPDFFAWACWSLRGTRYNRPSLQKRAPVCLKKKGT